VHRIGKALLLAGALALFGAGPTRGDDPPAPTRKENQEEALEKANALDERMYEAQDAGDPAAALEFAREALAIREAAFGPESIQAADNRHNLAFLLRAGGHLVEARQLYEHALAVRTQVLGRKHRDTAMTLFNLASLLREQEDHEAAITKFREVIPITRELFGAAHGATLRGQTSLAGSLETLDRWPEAEPARREVLRARLETLGPEHLRTGDAYAALAWNLRWQHKLIEARGHYEHAVAIRGAKLGADHPRLGLVLNNLAGLLVELENYEAALPAYERALAIARKRHGTAHPTIADAEHSLALCLQRMERYEGVEALHKSSLAFREQTLGSNHPKSIGSLKDYGEFLQQSGQPEKAQPILERALGLCEADPSRVPHHHVATLNALGMTQSDLGRPDLARPHLQRALELMGAEESRRVAATLSNLAHAARAQGELGEAHRLSERVVTLRTRLLGPEHKDTATAISLLGAIAWKLGDYDEAETHLLRALEIREACLRPGHPYIGWSLNHLAGLWLKQGRFAEARPLVERGLKILEGHFGPRHPETASALSSLASFYADQRLYHSALPLYEQALSILTETLPDDHQQLAAATNNVGFALQGLGRYEEALPLFERALDSMRRTSGARTLSTATALSNLAAAHLELGAHPEARNLLQESLSIQVEALGNGHPALTTPLQLLAAALADGGDLEGAIGRRREALAIMEDTFGANHPKTAQVATNFALMFFEHGRLDDAEPLFERGMAGAELALRQSLLASYRERLALADTRRVAFDDWMRFTAAIGRSGYPEVLRWKGLVGRLEAAQQRMLRNADAELRAEVTRRRELERKIARLAGSAPAAAEQRKTWSQQLAELQAQREEIALSIGQRSSEAREVTARLRLGLDDLQAELREGETLIDYVVYGNRYAAFVTTAKRPPVRFELGSIHEIHDAVFAFQAALMDAKRADDVRFQEAGRALRMLVWDPLAKAVGDARTVYVVPDGHLALAPLHALPSPKRNQQLADGRHWAVLGVAQQLVPWASSAPDSPRQGALVLGGVDYGTRAQSARRAFAPLPGTVTEVRSVAEELQKLIGADEEPRIEIRTGDAATETALRELATNCRYLHLATHGFAISPDTQTLFDLLPDVDAGVARHFFHDPLLFSGLALAGANERSPSGKDDGIMTALEVLALPLDGVELTVLSACETASGEVFAGEGVLGLVRAFNEAGAQNVVASLWRVDDDATQHLMQLFYEELRAEKGSRPPAAALAKASRRLRTLKVKVRGGRASLKSGRRTLREVRRFEAPRYWAGFVVYGPIR
jgi:CHAT domain-containing protein/Tfp pilus assembly protein PilF